MLRATGLQYRRNRLYDPATGRFTQQDPIGLAGGLNLYGYAGGDPINNSDPFGLCPGKSASGTICLAWFIATPTTLGGVLKGDNRDFQEHSGKSQSRAWAVIDPANGSVNSAINPSCLGASSGICADNINGADAFTVTADGNGGFDVHLSITNSLLPGSPAIDATLKVSPDGNGGYQVAGTRDGYPSFEAYYYRKDGSVQTMARQKEGSPGSLYPPQDKKVP